MPLPKLVIFGGTGGLGQNIIPLLEKEFEISAIGRNWVNVLYDYKVEGFFNEAQYIPNVIYMAVHNVDSTLHRLQWVDVEDQLETNIQGFLNVVRYCLPSMRENKYGRIIYVSSILSERPIPGTGIYSATKAFNDNLVRTCALENAKYNITCNSLQLGYFNAGLSKKVPQDLMQRVLEKTPMKRLGNAEDLTKPIKFILDSPFLTGVNLPLSGGLNIV